MKKIRFGLIGLGNQGFSYTTDIFDKGEIENGVLTAACDINPSKIENVKANTTNKDITYFNNYKNMLDSGLIDVAMVETPHYQHPEIVIECLKRGINVICEKPAGVYAEQVKEMNEFAKKQNAIFSMMFNQRTNCVYRKMKDMIENGDIGEVQRVTWIITQWYRTQQYYNSGSWRATWAGEGGGVLINQCPHQIDLIQWVVGMMPKTVRGFCHYGKWHDIEVEDDVTAYFEYENGATGVFITTTGEAPGTNRFEISGTKGKLVCEEEKLYFYKNAQDSKVFALDPKNTFGDSQLGCEVIEVETDGKNPQHAGIINNVANTLLGIEKLFVEGIEGINGVELMNAIEYSGWNDGAKVSVPIDDKKYLEKLNEKRANSRLKECDDSIVQNTAGTY